MLDCTHWVAKAGKAEWLMNDAMDKGDILAVAME